MQFLVPVEIIKSQQELSDNNRDILFRNETGFEQISTAAAGTEFHDDPEVRAFQEGAMILSDIG